MLYQIFVAEDETFVREGIRNCLEGTQDFALCGEAGDGEMALSAILELKPDILITDIKMPFMDGLALSRAVRRAMPWIRILIISGYDEFDFAKQAISIGVAEYLLKPFTSQTLLGTLAKLKEQMEEQRLLAQHADEHRLREQQEQQALRDAFLDSLLMGAHDIGKAMELAAHYGIDLPARKYLTVAIELQRESPLPNAAAQIRDTMDQLLHDRQDILWCLRGSDRLGLIAKGDTDAQLDELAYEAVNIIQGGLQRQLGIRMVSAIGPVAERVGELSTSFRHAQHTLRSLPLPAGTVVNFNDIQSGASGMGASGTGASGTGAAGMGAAGTGAAGTGAAGIVPLSQGVPVSQRLRHATRRDVEDIVADMRRKFADNSVNSILYGYYWLMDLLITAARTVSELGGDVHSVFPELEDTGAILRAASSESALVEIAQDVLERFLQFRESVKDSRYGDVIAQAKEYIYQHFEEGDLSLNTVASYCGFSPNHFSSIFSLNTGETFIGFLTRVRMEQARELLLQTDIRSADVAFRVGYHDPNYFRFLFKKHTGVSPRELRAAQESAAQESGAQE